MTGGSRYGSSPSTLRPRRKKEFVDGDDMPVPLVRNHVSSPSSSRPLQQRFLGSGGDGRRLPSRTIQSSLEENYLFWNCDDWYVTHQLLFQQDMNGDYLQLTFHLQAYEKREETRLGDEVEDMMFHQQLTAN